MIIHLDGATAIRKIDRVVFRYSFGNSMLEFSLFFVASMVYSYLALTKKDCSIYWNVKNL